MIIAIAADDAVRWAVVSLKEKYPMDKAYKFKKDLFSNQENLLDKDGALSNRISFVGHSGFAWADDFLVGKLGGLKADKFVDWLVIELKSTQTVNSDFVNSLQSIDLLACNAGCVSSNPNEKTYAQEVANGLWEEGFAITVKAVTNLSLEKPIPIYRTNLECDYQFGRYYFSAIRTESDNSNYNYSYLQINAAQKNLQATRELLGKIKSYASMPAKELSVEMRKLIDQKKTLKETKKQLKVTIEENTDRAEKSVVSIILTDDPRKDLDNSTLNHFYHSELLEKKNKELNLNDKKVLLIVRGIRVALMDLQDLSLEAISALSHKIIDKLCQNFSINIPKKTNKIRQMLALAEVVGVNIEGLEKTANLREFVFLLVDRLLEVEHRIHPNFLKEINSDVDMDNNEKLRIVNALGKKLLGIKNNVSDKDSQLDDLTRLAGVVVDTLRAGHSIRTAHIDPIKRMIEMLSIIGVRVNGFNETGTVTEKIDLLIERLFELREKLQPNKMGFFQPAKTEERRQDPIVQAPVFVKGR